MKKFLSLICVLSILAVPFPSAQADDIIIDDELDADAPTTMVTLQWNANRESDIAGYNVYYGRSSGVYTRLMSVTGPTAVIGIKGSRTVYFAVTAYNTSGEESDLSEEVHWP